MENQKETPQASRLRRLASLIYTARQTVILQTQEGHGPLAGNVAWLQELEHEHNILAAQHEAARIKAALDTVVKMTADLANMADRVAVAEAKDGPEEPGRNLDWPKSSVLTDEYQAAQVRANEEMNEKLDAMRAGPPTVRAMGAGPPTPRPGAAHTTEPVAPEETDDLGAPIAARPRTNVERMAQSHESLALALAEMVIEAKCGGFHSGGASEHDPIIQRARTAQRGARAFRPVYVAAPAPGLKGHPMKDTKP